MWQFPSEYVPTLDQERIGKIFDKNGLHISRMIGFSKSQYREANPYHEIYFNANIITINYGKVWHGDLDVDLDKEKLIAIAKKIKEPLFILYEHDARFENENRPIKEFIDAARCTINPDGSIDSKNREAIEKLKESGENPYRIVRIPLEPKKITKIVERFVDMQMQHFGLTAEDVKKMDKKDNDKFFKKYRLTQKQFDEFMDKSTKYLKTYYKLDQEQVDKLLGEFNLFYGLSVKTK